VTSAVSESPVPDEIESSYYTAQGFDPAHSRQVRSHYLPFVLGRGFLVELGCGRGEFLSLVAEQQPEARRLGVDVDPEMVRQVREAGHEAVEDDLLTYLHGTSDRPDAVFLAHVIEHLSVGEAFAMFGRLREVIPAGGRLIVVTPNPACFANLSNDFWSDPTHVRLYTLDLLQFLLGETGFEVIDAGGNPLDVPGPPPELLTPVANLDAWGAAEMVMPEPTPITFDEGVAVEGILEELTRLRATVASAVHWMGIYNDRMIEMRHLAESVAAAHDASLRHLYGANEIYVVGERTA